MRLRVWSAALALCAAAPVAAVQTVLDTSLPALNGTA